MRPAEGGATGSGEGQRTAESDWERSDWLLEFAPSETRKSAAQLFTDTANDTARVAQMELIPDQLATTREGDPSAGAKHLFFCVCGTESKRRFRRLRPASPEC